MNYLKDMFESLDDYRKLVILMFLIKNDSDLFKECGFLKSDINRLSLEFENILLEQNEDYLDHIENEEESIIEKILNKKMETDINCSQFWICEWNNILL